MMWQIAAVKYTFNWYLHPSIYSSMEYSILLWHKLCRAFTLDILASRPVACCTVRCNHNPLEGRTWPHMDADIVQIPFIWSICIVSQSFLSKSLDISVTCIHNSTPKFELRWYPISCHYDLNYLLVYWDHCWRIDIVLMALHYIYTSQNDVHNGNAPGIYSPENKHRKWIKFNPLRSDRNMWQICEVKLVNSLAHWRLQWNSR